MVCRSLFGTHLQQQARGGAGFAVSEAISQSLCRCGLIKVLHLQYSRFTAVFLLLAHDLAGTRHYDARRVPTKDLAPDEWLTANKYVFVWECKQEACSLGLLLNVHFWVDSGGSFRTLLQDKKIAKRSRLLWASNDTPKPNPLAAIKLSLLDHLRAQFKKGPERVTPSHFYVLSALLLFHVNGLLIEVINNLFLWIQRFEFCWEINELRSSKDSN